VLIRRGASAGALPGDGDVVAAGGGPGAATQGDLPDADSGDWSVLSVSGELDVVGAPELRQAVLQTLGEGRRRLILDLSGVDFIDSFGLGVLVGALKRVRMVDGELRLVIAERRVLRVLELCDLDRVFDIRARLPT